MTRTEEMIAACRAGEKYTYVAALFGVSVSAVSMAAKRAGLPKKATGQAKKPRSFAAYLHTNRITVARKARLAKIAPMQDFPTLRWLAERLNSRMRHGALTGDRT